MQRAVKLVAGVLAAFVAFGSSTWAEASMNAGGGDRAVPSLHPEAVGMDAENPPVTTECDQVWNPWCTTRLSRGATRNVRDGAVLSGIAAATWCGPAAPVCAGLLAAEAASMALRAGRFYEDGDCLGIRWNRLSLVLTHQLDASSVRVEGGTYNCR